MSFDKKNRYMSKIHVILVVLSMYFFKRCQFEANLFSTKKYTNLSFRIFHYTQSKYSKEGKNKKNDRGNLFETHFEYCEFLVL